jgi:hypothetical protein
VAKEANMSVTPLFSDADPTLTNRYLAGQLTDAERATFETELERNPAALQELEATARLKVGLERLREMGQLDYVLRPTSTLQQVFVGLAATLAVGVIAISFLMGYFGRQGTDPLLAATSAAFADTQGSALPVSATFVVFRKRASDYDAVIELPATRTAIELRVLPQIGTPSRRYRVSLAQVRDDTSVAPVETLGDLLPESDGFVTVFADSARLAPGRYRMSISDAQGTAPTDTFLLNVLPAAPSHSE